MALKLFNSTEAHGVEPNVITFSVAISACEKGGQWEMALKLLNSMGARGLNPMSSPSVLPSVGDCAEVVQLNGGLWIKAQCHHL
jgi:pentatricopeptide repeat protein